jgi:arylformamidase
MRPSDDNGSACGPSGGKCVFSIDYSKYRLVDLSTQVVPGQTDPYRPFDIVEGRLGDGTRKFDIVNTHTHVGTHVESPWHFYGERNTCTDYPLTKFLGPATLLKAKPGEGKERVDVEDVKAQLEARRGKFSILVVRNDTAEKPLRFTMDCVPYFAGLNIDLFVFEMSVEFGQGLEDGRAFHDIMLSKDILLVEIPANLHDLDKDSFFVFAMPLNVRRLDSSACRLFAIVER